MLLATAIILFLLSAPLFLAPLYGAEDQWGNWYIDTPVLIVSWGFGTAILGCAIVCFIEYQKQRKVAQEEMLRRVIRESREQEREVVPPQKPMTIEEREVELERLQKELERRSAESRNPRI